MTGVIYELRNGKQVPLVTCSLIDGQVNLQGDSQFIEKLELEGVRNFTFGQTGQLFPADGEAFIRQLPYNYRNTYLEAVITP